MGLKMKMVFLGLKMKSLAMWALAHWAELLVALTLLGSGVVMKAAPYFQALGYVQAKLPIELGLTALEKEIRSSYGSFVKLPLIKKAFGYLSAIGIKGTSSRLLIGIALLDLVCGALLLLPKGKRTAKAAGLWMVIEMIGAEYCTRMSGSYLSSAKKLPYHEMVMTVVHVLIGFAGIWCMRKESLNLGGWMWSLKPKLAFFKKAPATSAAATASATAAAKPEVGGAATASARGRAAMPGGTAQKRTSTPGPKSSPKSSAKKSN